MMQIASVVVRGVLLGGMVVAVFGCGKEDDEKVTTELEGAWTKACQAGTGDDEGTSSKEAVVISGLSANYTVTSYSDGDCATETMRVELSNSFTVGEELSEPAGARVIDMKANAIKFTLLNDTMVQAFNTLNYCGGGFVKGEAKSVTAADCEDPDIKAAFTGSFDLYKITDSKLFLGDTSADANYDGTTAEKRPRVLQSSGFTKQ